MTSRYNNPSKENDLINRAVSGQRMALQELLLCYSDRLASYINRRLPQTVRDTIGPDDILQETFTVAFREISQFENRENGSFLPWLCAIARNRTHDALKAHNRKKRGGGMARVRQRAVSPDESVVDLFYVLASDSSTASRKIARNEAAHAVHVALAGLPEHYQEAIRLRYFHGKSLEEVAHAMRTTPGAVQGLIKRAKQRLRESLDRASKYLSSK